MKQIFLSIISHFTVRVANLFRKKSGQKEGGLQKAASVKDVDKSYPAKEIGREEKIQIVWLEDLRERRSQAVGLIVPLLSGLNMSDIQEVLKDVENVCHLFPITTNPQ